MAEAVKHRFFNIKTATHGATSVTTIQSVDFDADVQEIADSGDDDAVDTARRRPILCSRVPPNPAAWMLS
jgi:hypothetical protein